MILLLCAALALIVAGCGASPKTRYYTLTPVGSARPRAATAEPLRVSQVVIPDRLDRSGLVEWSGSGELKISNRDRWASPLDEMVRRTVAEDLRERLPGMVYLPGDATPPGNCRAVSINIRRFAAQGSRRVVLLADWSLLSNNATGPLLSRSEKIEVPIGSDDSHEVVAAMSEAVGELSDRIAAAIAAQSNPT